MFIRYGNAEGDWIGLTQGFGGIYSSYPSGAPGAIPRGTTTVGGIEAKWLRGRNIGGDIWEAGTMTVLAWDVSSAANGSPITAAIASNVLGLEELRTVAESLR